MKKVLIPLTILISALFIYAKTQPIDSTRIFLPQTDSLSTSIITYKEELPYILKGKCLTFLDSEDYKISDVYGNIFNYYGSVNLKSGIYIVFSKNKQYKLFVK